MEDVGGFYREYFVNLTFTGWKEIPLAVPETARLFKHTGGDFQLPSGNNNKMAMRNFQWRRSLGINFFITGVTQANISIGAITGRAESPATLASAILQTGAVKLRIPALRGGGGHCDYVECEDVANATTCTTFDADGHILSSVGADAMGEYVAAWETDAMSVEFASPSPQPRLEVTVMERNDDKLGPFPLKTDSDSDDEGNGANAPVGLASL